MPQVPSPPAHLEGQSGAHEQHEDELEVLVDGPQRLDGAVGVVYEELQSGRGEDLVRKQEPAFLSTLSIT